MFNKSRRKIIISIMGSVLILFAATLTVILLASYGEVRRTNAQMLDRYVDLYPINNEFDPDINSNDDKGDPGNLKELSGGIDKGPYQAPPLPAPFGMREGPMELRPDYRLSTFYAVVFDNDGNVIDVNDGDKEVYSEDELTDMAQKLLASGKASGRTGSLIYKVSQRDSYTLIAFMDSTVSESGLTMLLRNVLIVGSIAIVILFFMSLYLSGKIIRPLEENDKKQKQFISDASHELKTPVAVISANSELLSREIGDNEWLDNIKYENKRMGDLVGELLMLSRAESAEVKAEETDLSRIVTGEILAFDSLAFEHNKTIDSDIAENIRIKGNPAQLSQLSSILLDNAIKHSTGSEIKVSLTGLSHGAILTVSNESDMIPEDKLEKLFDRFYRLDEARSDEDSHFGLGLSIARAITMRHKGNISASWHDGRISFVVTLPLTTARA